MVTIKFIIVIATVINLVTCSYYPFFFGLSLAPLVFRTIFHKLSDYCITANSTDVELETMEELHHNFSSCVSDFSNVNQSLCRTFINNVQSCSQPLLDNFEDCFPDKSKDLPRALIEVTVSVAETFCRSNGELLLEILNPCLYKKIEDHKRPIPVKKDCTSKVLTSNLNQKLASKSVACQVGRSVFNCWQEYVVSECESTKTKKLVSTMYNAVFSVCKENNGFGATNTID